MPKTKKLREKLIQKQKRLIINLMPTLYLNFLSQPSRAVYMVAKKLGIEFEVKEINLAKGEHKAEDYLKINPRG